MLWIHGSIDLADSSGSPSSQAGRLFDPGRTPMNPGGALNTRPILRGGYAAAFLAVAMLLPGLGAASDAMLDILRSSASSPSSGLKAEGSVKAPAESFATRTGDVILGTDRLLPMAGAAGRQSFAPGSLASRSLAVEFFPDAYVEIVVASESRPDPNTLSLNGHLPDSDLSTFSLTVTPETYLMTFSDPNGVYLYRVTGDTETGIGQVTEYDLRNRPAVIHSTPLIPPLD